MSNVILGLKQKVIKYFFYLFFGDAYVLDITTIYPIKFAQNSKLNYHNLKIKA
jgi:hypothetical protein